MLCISGVANAIVFALDKDMRSNLNTTKLRVRQSRMSHNVVVFDCVITYPQINISPSKTGATIHYSQLKRSSVRPLGLHILNNIGQRQILYHLPKMLTFDFAYAQIQCGTSTAMIQLITTYKRFQKLKFKV